MVLHDIQVIELPLFLADEVDDEVGLIYLVGNGNQNTISDLSLIFLCHHFPPVCKSLIYKGYFKGNCGKNGEVLGVDCTGT